MKNEYSSALRALIAQGWIVQSEGPSGAQMIEPRRLTRQNRMALWVGCVLVFVFGVGLLLLLLVALQHYVLQKQRTHFLSREAPAFPPVIDGGPGKGFRII